MMVWPFLVQSCVQECRETSAVTNWLDFGVLGVQSGGHRRAGGRGTCMRDAEFSQWIFFLIIYLISRRQPYSVSLISPSSLVVRRTQLECSEGLAEIQTLLPGTDWMMSHLLLWLFLIPCQVQECCLDLKEPFCLYMGRLRTFKGFISEGDVRVGASERSCYHPKHISRI